MSVSFKIGKLRADIYRFGGAVWLSELHVREDRREENPQLCFSTYNGSCSNTREPIPFDSLFSRGGSAIA
jgi:hypothetical protein